MTKAIARSLLVVVAFCSIASAAEIRNPFDIPDIVNPTGDDVQAHAARVKLAGDKDDPNASAWPPEVSKDEPMKLDGKWWGRWNGGGIDYTAPTETRVAKRGDRLFILHGGWYVEAIKQKDGRYAGRWVSAGSTTGGGTWVGNVVNDERIDGDWDTGRWDFRRRFE